MHSGKYSFMNMRDDQIKDWKKGPSHVAARFSLDLGPRNTTKSRETVHYLLKRN